jgi:hypothetical protein
VEVVVVGRLQDLGVQVKVVWVPATRSGAA